MNRHLIKLVIILIMTSKVNAQKPLGGTPVVELSIGKPMPDFKLKNVEYYHLDSVTLKDFAGKWLMLDFWNRRCANCIESFPRMDSLQKKYSEHLQIVLIGYTGSQYIKRFGPDDKQIRELYKRQRENFNLNLPVVFDSTFFHHLGVSSCPYIIIVDPFGIIRGITYKITDQDFQKFLINQTPNLPKAYRRGEAKDNL